MLETIKSCIDSLPDTSFHEYYAHYIMSVQDNNICAELQFLKQHNLLNTGRIDLMIENTYKELVAICSTTDHYNLLM